MVAMPERLVDDDFVAQSGLSIVVTLPVQQLVPPFAGIGELGVPVAVFGGASDGDSIKLVPVREACAPLYALPVTDGAYAQCACTGAAASDQGGALAEGQLQLVSGIAFAGMHVVCHAFASAGDGATQLDSDYEPQRGVVFEGVNRSTAIAALEPNATLAHFDTTVRVRSAHPGYLRLVHLDLEGLDAADGALSRTTLLGGRRLQAGGQPVGAVALTPADLAALEHVCSNAATLVQRAPGGELSAVSAEGVRTLRVRLDDQGTYIVCHAFKSQLEEKAELEELFTLQLELVLTVAFALPSVSPPLLLINERTLLRLPGAAPGDIIKLMPRRATGCTGAAASLDGGAVITPGKLVVRVVDAYLLAPLAQYVVCHAFNYTGGASDADYHTQFAPSGEELNVTVAYPVQAIITLDVHGVVVRSTTRKRLALRLPDAAANRVQAGDALVVLPTAVGQCSGAAALYFKAVCDPQNSGDDTPASFLGLPPELAGDGTDGVETRLLRLDPGTHAVCHAFASDLFNTGELSLLDADALELAPSPPPPAAIGARCPDPSLYQATDAHFRVQYGVQLQIESPIVSIAPSSVVVGDAQQRVEVSGGAVGDMVRWLPACEAVCGNAADDGDFPFTTLSADPLTSSPPPPNAPNPPTAPDAPASPGVPLPPYLGPLSLPTGALRAALYKACYAYAEDLEELPPPAAAGRWPQMGFAVEVPLRIGSTALRVARAHAPPTVSLHHAAPTTVSIAFGDWQWFRLSLECDGASDGVPIAGCTPGAALQAALEIDTAFSRERLRYHSVHALLAHAPVRQPPLATVAVDAPSCFDGLDEGRLERFVAGYLQRPGAEVVEAEVNGFTQRLNADRLTYHVGTNTSSGGCNILPTPELWIRLQCAAASLPAGACTVTLRAVLLPVAIPTGFDHTIEVPIEPGASDGSSRAILHVALSDADIFRVTVVAEGAGCAGEPAGSLAAPNNATLLFAGEILAQREGCPHASGLSGYLPGYRAAPSVGSGTNATLEFFCTNAPGLYVFLLDGASQPLSTVGPPAIADEGEPTGSYEDSPLSDTECPLGWQRLLDGINSNRSADAQLSALPRAWAEGGTSNVLRRGRLRVRLEVYRSQPFNSQPLVDGERREACLAYEQTRTFSILTTEAGNSTYTTLFVSVDAPISAAYARHGAPPDLENGEYDVSIALAHAPRWGCADAQCTAGQRVRFALSASTCEPDVPTIWYVSLRLNSPEAVAAESIAASAAGSMLQVQPARFFVTMLLYSADLSEVVGAAAPTFTLPAAASPQAAAAASGGGGAGFVGGGGMLQLRLRGIQRSLAPLVDVRLSHGTLRALYLQRSRCATSASGLSAAGDGESASCGIENLPDCVVRWMARFSPYYDQKLYQPSATLQAHAMREIEARNEPPVDWWITIESDTNDVAEAQLTVTLVGAALLIEKLCYFARFCPDYRDPAKRYRDVERDGDDSARAFLQEYGRSGAAGKQVARRASLATLAAAIVATILVLY